MEQLLKTLLEESVNACYQLQDKILIDLSMERASVARIFYYMQNAIYTDDRFQILREYNLDSEYTRFNGVLKRTPRCPNGAYPDIILHKRKNIGDCHCSDDNLLVVEFKPRKNAMTEKDKEKIEDFTARDIYEYRLGCFVKLTKRQPKFYYCQNGVFNPPVSV